MLCGAESWLKKAMAQEWVPDNCFAHTSQVEDPQAVVLTRSPIYPRASWSIASASTFFSVVRLVELKLVTSLDMNSVDETTASIDI